MTTEDLFNGQVTDIIAGHFERAYTADAGLGVGAERGEPVGPFKDSEVSLCGWWVL